MSALGALLWLLAAVAVLIAAALVMPLGLRLQASIDGRVRWKLEVQPFGRFGPVIRSHGRRTEEKPEPKMPARKPAKGRWRKMHRVPAAALRFAQDVLSIIHFQRLSLDLRFGCSDPADTGHVYGLLTPVLYGSSGLPKTELRFDPVFDRAELDCEAELEVSFVPAALLPPLLRLGWSVLRPAR